MAASPVSANEPKDATTNVPVVNGYSGRAPEDYDDHDILTEQQLHDWLAPRYHGRLWIVNVQHPSEKREVDFSTPAEARR